MRDSCAYERIRQIYDVQIHRIYLYPVFVLIVMAKRPGCTKSEVSERFAAYVPKLVIYRFLN